MTEIEKMFENAGVKKTYCFIYETNRQCEGIVDCAECASADYPPFSAEKQIELIKLLGKRARISLEIDFYNKTNFYSDYDIIDGWFKYQAKCNIFEETLAQIINILWQDLTDQEKEEIRNILK